MRTRDHAVLQRLTVETRRQRRGAGSTQDSRVAELLKLESAVDPVNVVANTSSSSLMKVLLQSFKGPSVTELPALKLKNMCRKPVLFVITRFLARVPIFAGGVQLLVNAAPDVYIKPDLPWLLDGLPSTTMLVRFTLLLNAQNTRPKLLVKVRSRPTNVEQSIVIGDWQVLATGSQAAASLTIFRFVMVTLAPFSTKRKNRSHRRINRIAIAIYRERSKSDM